MRVLRVLAVVAASGLVAPAAAAARDVAVPVRAEIEPTLAEQLVSALRLEVRIPGNARVVGGGRERGAAVLATTRGRCTVQVGLLAETASSRQGLGPGR